MPFPAAHKICHQYAFISIHIITQTPYLMLRNNQFHQYQQIPLQLTKMLSTWCLSPFLLLLFLLYFSQNVSFEELAAEYEKVIADRAFLSQGVNAILHSLDETAESIGLGPKNGHLLYQTHTIVDMYENLENKRKEVEEMKRALAESQQGMSRGSASRSGGADVEKMEAENDEMRQLLIQQDQFIANLQKENKQLEADKADAVALNEQIVHERAKERERERRKTEEQAQMLHFVRLELEKERRATREREEQIRMENVERRRRRLDAIRNTREALREGNSGSIGANANNGSILSSSSVTGTPHTPSQQRMGNAPVTVTPGSSRTTGPGSMGMGTTSKTLAEQEAEEEEELDWVRLQERQKCESEFTEEKERIKQANLSALQAKDAEIALIRQTYQQQMKETEIQHRVEIEKFTVQLQQAREEVDQTHKETEIQMASLNNHIFELTSELQQARTEAESGKHSEVSRVQLSARVELLAKETGQLQADMTRLRGEKEAVEKEARKLKNELEEAV